MAYKIPQPIALLPGGQGLPNLPSRTFEAPKEGRRYIPVEIDWDGSGTTYQINVNGITTQPFSQIVMMDVDNTASGAAVTFYFPDSIDTLTVPAESAGTFPVFTGGLLMYASAPGSLATDVTRFRILNYRQEPIANPAPQLTQVATALAIVANGTTAVIPSVIAGTLTGYEVNVGLQNTGGAAETCTITLKDHTSGNVIDQSTVILATGGGTFNGPLMNVTGAAIRFAGGIDVVVSGTASVINVNVSLRYHTP